MSTSVVKQLGLDYESCKEHEAQEEGNQKYKIVGQVDLLWHRTNIAKQFPATFYVIESGTDIVIFGRDTSLSHRNDGDKGLFPLFNGQQTCGKD